MPTTYNGIGTHYWGKRNLIARDGYCPHCNRAARLTSYDTTLFFVVLFLPIIPLGKKRIMDACSACTRHFAVPMQTYYEARARDYAEADRLMAAAKTEKEAIQAVATVLQYREPDVIYRLIRDGDARFAASAEWNEFLIEANRFMSRFADAEAAAARSLAAREDTSVRESLAEFQFARDDVDAGRATLEPLLSAPSPAPSPAPSRAVQMGVDALQRRGRHVEALEMLNRVAIPPNAPADLVKAFAKQRAISEKILAKSLADPAKFEIAGDGAIVRRKPVRFAAAKWAAAIAAVLGVAFSGYSIYLGTSRPATLVNGTDVAYTATIDGRAYTLQAHEFKPIRVSEGDIVMSIAAPGYTGPATSTFHFATSFFRRPFDGDALVLNPDGLASIVTGEVTYGPAGSTPTGSGRPDKVYAGDLGYVLSDIDYAFVDPPASVSTTGDARPPTYSIAYVDKDMRPEHASHELVGRREEAKAATLARSVMNWPLTDADDTDWIVTTLGPAETIAALAPRVAVRPLEVESHRAYQSLREWHGQEQGLTAEYEKMLAADPTNGSLMYLLGRTIDDSNAAIAMYRRAQSATPPEPMAYTGEAYHLAARADYEGALTAARAGRKVRPQDSRLRELEWDLLMATRRYADALAMLNEKSPSAETMGDFGHRLEVLLASGREREIDGLIATRTAMLMKKFGPEGSTLEGQFCKMKLAYLRHDERGFAEACPVETVKSLRFPAAICRRDIAGAERLMNEAGEADGPMAMQVYLAAETAGNREAAARALTQAIAAWRKGSSEMATMAGWLAGDRVPTAKQLADWPHSPAGKSVALAVLASARPQLRPICAPLAERLNYSMSYPHELVAASLVKGR